MTTGLRRSAFVALRTVEANLGVLRRRGVPAIVDLRADAYGHGLLAVATALRSADGFVISAQARSDQLEQLGVPLTTDAGRVTIGAEVFGLGDALPTRPVLRLVTEAVAVKRVPADRGVSYGYTYRTTGSTTLVLAALGYADGVPRIASNRAPVQVGAIRSRVTGRIAMDQFVVDLGVTDSGIKVGDDVVLFGDPARGEPHVAEWSRTTGIPAYVLTTALGPRVERVYT